MTYQQVTDVSAFIEVITRAFFKEITVGDVRRFFCFALRFLIQRVCRIKKLLSFFR